MIISLFSSGGGGTGGKKVVALPLVDKQPLIYDGTTKSVSIYPYSTDLITVSGNTGQNAGTYNAQFTLKDKNNYMWSNTLSSDDQTVPWTIERAVGSISASATSVEIGKNETKTVTITTTEGTTISAASSDTSIATVSVSGNVVSITDGGTSGEATITVSAADSTNYTYSNTILINVIVDRLTIVTWANGTDAEIVDMVEAADAGDIDLSDYWNVGDERTILLSAMSATGVGESHVAQDVTFVLMSADTGVENSTNPCWNYQYVTAKTGRNYPSFIVEQKNMLANGTSSEGGQMNSSTINSGSWNGCIRRTWCNNVYYNAIPSTIKTIFKQVDVKTINTYNGSSMQTSQDYFFLPAEREIFDSRAYSNNTEWNNLSQFDYYKTSANRIKYKGNAGSAYYWWERSPNSNNSKSFCYVDSYGNANYANATYAYGLAPCGCI